MQEMLTISEQAALSDAIKKLDHAGYDVRTAIPPVWDKESGHVVAVVGGEPCTFAEVVWKSKRCV